MDLSFDFFAEQLRQLRDGQAIIDIILVSIIIFVILRLIQGTRAVQVLNGFFIVVAIFYIIITASEIQLTGLNWLISQIVPILFIAIPVIFQPELRRALEQVGGAGRYLRIFQRHKPNPALQPVIQASKRLSQRRHGALIVFEKNTGLQEYVDTGVSLQAEASTELLLTIFNKNTELHDGAMIIRDGKVEAAACVMPLSAANVSDRQMGLRHRAALGISEVSDAVSLIVSEETGQFAITHNGRILRKQDPERLHTILEAFLQDTVQDQISGNFLQRLRREPISLTRVLGTLLSNLFTLSLSLVLSLIIWSAALQANDPTVSKSLLLDVEKEGILAEEGNAVLAEDSVRITISGPTSVINPLVDSDFKAFVDRSALPLGQSSAPIVVLPQVENGDLIEIVLQEPEITEVEVERTISKEIRVMADIRGESARGHEQGPVVLDPSLITITGPENLVDEIAQASVTVFLESPREDVIRIRPPTYINTDGLRTGISGIETDTDEIRITVPITETADVADLSIVAAVEGVPQEGYRLLGIEVEPSTVLVTGPPNVLANLRSINTEIVEITGATESITTPVTLDLPAGINIDEDIQSVTVSVIIEPIETTDIRAVVPEVRALGDGLSATFEPEEIRLFLAGPIQALNSLTDDDINVTLDLFNLEAGVYTVQPVVNINVREIEIRSFQPEEVTVIIEDPVTLEEELEDLFGEDVPNLTGTPGTPNATSSETVTPETTPNGTPTSTPVTVPTRDSPVQTATPTP